MTHSPGQQFAKNSKNARNRSRTLSSQQQETTQIYFVSSLNCGKYTEAKSLTNYGEVISQTVSTCNMSSWPPGDELLIITQKAQLFCQRSAVWSCFRIPQITGVLSQKPLGVEFHSPMA